MSNNTIRMIAAKPSLDNAPHMLRRLAAAIESGEVTAEAVIVVTLPAGDHEAPGVHQFGADGSRMKAVGALFDAAQRMLRRES